MARSDPACSSAIRTANARPWTILSRLQSTTDVWTVRTECHASMPGGRTGARGKLVPGSGMCARLDICTLYTYRTKQSLRDRPESGSCASGTVQFTTLSNCAALLLMHARGSVISNRGTQKYMTTLSQKNPGSGLATSEFFFLSLFGFLNAQSSAVDRERYIHILQELVKNECYSVESWIMLGVRVRS